jgi:nicotinamidase-related amidase
MSEPWLVVVDMQNVFAEPDSPWAVPRFAEVIEPIEALVAAHAPRVTFTRFVAPAEPAGAWVPYYEQWGFALQPPDAELYALVPAFADRAADTLDAPTFSKWTPELASILGPDASIVVAGVATEACVMGTVLGAADAGVRVRVAADACAGVDDAAHEQSLAVMRLWAPLVEVTGG